MPWCQHGVAAGVQRAWIHDEGLSQHVFRPCFMNVAAQAGCRLAFKDKIPHSLGSCVAAVPDVVAFGPVGRRVGQQDDLPVRAGFAPHVFQPGFQAGFGKFAGGSKRCKVGATKPHDGCFRGELKDLPVESLPCFLKPFCSVGPVHISKECQDPGVAALNFFQQVPGAGGAAGGGNISGNEDSGSGGEPGDVVQAAKLAMEVARDDPEWGKRALHLSTIYGICIFHKMLRRAFR